MEKLITLVGTAEEFAIVVEALQTDAAKRQRAAAAAAGELEADVEAGRVTDRRPAAVRIVKVLADAAVLTRFASQIDTAARVAAPQGSLFPPGTDAAERARIVASVQNGSHPADIDPATIAAAADMATAPPPLTATVLDEETPVDPIAATADVEAADV